MFWVWRTGVGGGGGPLSPLSPDYRAYLGSLLFFWGGWALVKEGRSGV